MNTILSAETCDTAAFVKFLVLVNGAGVAAPWIALIDDKNMKEGRTETFPIDELRKTIVILDGLL